MRAATHLPQWHITTAGALRAVLRIGRLLKVVHEAKELRRAAADGSLSILNNYVFFCLKYGDYISLLINDEFVNHHL